MKGEISTKMAFMIILALIFLVVLVASLMYIKSDGMEETLSFPK